jgi:hypothetical protein
MLSLVDSFISNMFCNAFELRESIEMTHLMRTLTYVRGNFVKYSRGDRALRVELNPAEKMKFYLHDRGYFKKY